MLRAALGILLGETTRYRLRGALNGFAPSSAGGAGAETTLMAFTCNICGRPGRASREDLESERPTCTGCGSTARFRAVILGLSLGLYGEGRALPEFPTDKRIRGAGMTDWVGYAHRLAATFDYTNTYYHKVPRLDIVDESTLTPDHFDFLLSSDVMEHVRPPVADGFVNALRVLKPGGVFVVTVPCSAEPATREHFSELKDYALARFRDELVLLNRTADGRLQAFENLVFHGGPGEAMEMRTFSRTGVAEVMRNAGFVDVRIIDDHPGFGIVDADPPQGVLTIGRKPA